VISRFFVRGVGFEGREVGFRVEGEARDRSLEPLPALRLDDDVRNLTTLLVSNHLRDATGLCTVSRPRF
jgi:hypothetical protein